MRYAIVSFGRCGSQWAADLVAAVTDRPREFDLDRWQQTQSVFHTHEMMDIIPALQHKDCRTIICVRQDSFRKILSMEVARYTTEYTHYTYHRYFHPFQIDAAKFIDDVINDQRLQPQMIRELADQGIDYRVCKYEDLVGAADPYVFIEHLVDPADIAPGYDRDVKENPNPRDYTQLVTNYQELKNLWDETQNKLL